MMILDEIARHLASRPIKRRRLAKRHGVFHRNLRAWRPECAAGCGRWIATYRLYCDWDAWRLAGERAGGGSRV